MLPRRRTGLMCRLCSRLVLVHRLRVLLDLLLYLLLDLRLWDGYRFDRAGAAGLNLGKARSFQPHLSLALAVKFP